jgi:transposase
VTCTVSHRGPCGLLGRPLSGNHESAGKRLSGRTRCANPVLRQALVESARAAVCKRGSYLAAQYRRLVKRRGDKKAIVAVAEVLSNSRARVAPLLELKLSER